MSDNPEVDDSVEDDGPEASVITRSARVVPVVIEEEMKASYLDYAMSVIVGRALPDVRDGLKPVHRRILYSMDEAGLRPDRPYRKCASAVGDVMKKYHPHGDSAIYDALVRMGQDFSIRAELVDGHGNFGSIDGDPPAAMRYTEARLSKLAMELLRDIDESTVDFRDNYDGYEQEPVVLPSRFPNLLVNGSTGIAVGMATNIPPHNLGEVIDATVALIDNPELTPVELMEHMPSPDFPTGGLILGQAGAHEAYTTGRGTIRVRAVCEIEENGTGGSARERIVVTEIPYMVNKANLVTKIADLVRHGKIKGISDLRDESSREGLRMVVDLKRDANAQVVLNQLYKHTQLQDSFSVNCIALVDGVPQLLSLDKVLMHYLDHQIEVVRRRTEHRLKKAEARAHVLEGLLVAHSNIDRVIALIRGAESAAAAKVSLIEEFDLSDIQAQAILDMQLRRLAALEASEIQREYDQLSELITELRGILDSEELIRNIVKTELLEIKDKFADPRRSRIIADDGAMTVEDLIPQKDIVVTLTRGGYIKRTDTAAFKVQRRGGRGVRGAAIREDDVVNQLLTCTTHDILLAFTNQGRVYRIKAYQIPEKSREAKGVYVANVPGLALEQDEKVATILNFKTFREDEDRFLLFATKDGRVKRTSLDEYDSSRSVLIAIGLRDGDELIHVAITSGDDDVLLVSRNGKAIRFSEQDARAMGRSASGVIGMKLKGDDRVLAMAPVTADDDDFLLVVTEGGLGKRTRLSEYPTQGRGGQGVITAKLSSKGGPVAGAVVAPLGAEILLIGSGGTVIRMSSIDVRPTGRSTQGVSVMNVKDGSQVTGLALVIDDDEDGQPDHPPTNAPQEVDAGGDAAPTVDDEPVDSDEPGEEK